MRKLRVILTGASGMLAQDLQSVFSDRYQVYPLSKDKLDITSKKEVESAIFGLRPDIVVNCAAFTKVDECEVNPLCYEVNGIGVFNLTEACRKLGTRMVHFSTDYVFDGTGTAMHREDAARNPINSYGKSKLFGEIALNGSKHLLIRVQWLFGKNGPNFVDTMLRLAKNNKEIKVVSDQFGRPTNTAILARSVFWLIKQGAEGDWNLASSNFCSWYEFAKEILKKHPVQVVPCSSDDFPRPAKRPKNGVLDVSKALYSGVDLYPWQDHLDFFL